MLSVGRGHPHQAFPVAQDASDRADFLGRTEGTLQETDGVEILKPLTVPHVTLATGNAFDVPSVHQGDFDPSVFQDRIKGDPIHSGGFHRYGPDVTGSEPIRESVEVRGKRGEGANGLGIPVLRNGDVDLGRADVDPGGLRVKDGQAGGRLGHSTLSSSGGTDPVE
jgi:hypothetical protein